MVHFHIDYLHFSQSRHSDIKQVTTLHGRLDLPDLVDIFQEFKEMPVISVSRAQRKPLPQINWAANVYHGLPKDLFSCCPEPGKYLAFIGRICPEKRPDRAIEIAMAAGSR
jgi:glycosyltransferase involved in cell wall biosynthesis